MPWFSRQAVDGNDLTIGLQKGEGDQADPFIIIQGDESAHVLGVEGRSVGDHKIAIPLSLPKLAQPGQVRGGDAMDGDH